MNDLKAMPSDNHYKMVLLFHIFPRSLVAQLVREHRTSKPKVVGLKPSRGRVDFSACPIWLSLRVAFNGNPRS